ncbi:class I SAM-dependent methyltransferase [Halomicronema sp. CCY15110]|uniref:class I SAM-dependent methyltransferase n=1 Tax=Halomicronema sp. CCY15110 TaxID=2767773 RepID=UPI00195109BF|nr:class I SAM-dependent methyltransferase [Halomicronema sp. CCY15110]
MSLFLQYPQERSLPSIKPDSTSQLLLDQNIHLLTEQEAARGAQPWDIICQTGQVQHVLNQFKRFKTLGLGNTYAQALWRCDRIDLLSKRLFALNFDKPANSILFEMPNSFQLLLEQFLYKVFNISLIRQRDVAKNHYDLPTELYEGFLGETMKYTTGDWTSLEPISANLSAAQFQNLDYWFNELQIKDGDVILDCGCGWGTLPDYLKHRADVTYIGITISDVQIGYCRSKFKGLDKYYFYNHSYHDRYPELLSQVGVDQITKCIFLETIEHGGVRNWPHILKHVREVLSPQGLLGIQTIGAEHPNLVCDPYINRYIFQHLSIGSPSELGQAIERNRQFVKLKEHNIGHHYPATLRAWNDLFQRNWTKIQPHIQHILDTTPFDNVEAWKRHWEFYLLLCVGAFEAGTYPQVYQLTAKPNFFFK